MPTFKERCRKRTEQRMATCSNEMESLGGSEVQANLPYKTRVLWRMSFSLTLDV